MPADWFGLVVLMWRLTLYLPDGILALPSLQAGIAMSDNALMDALPPVVTEPTDHAKRARQRIYEQAMTLFERKGFAGTSMSDIAQACDVTKPTLYYYFRNKSHLLEVLYEDITADFLEQSRQIAVSTEPADIRLQQLVTDLVLYNIDHRRFLRIFWRERSELDSDARAALAALERRFETIVLEVITSGVQDGHFRPCDTEVAMFSILGLLSTVQNWAPYAKADPACIAAEISALVLQSLAVQGEARSRRK